MLTQPNQYELFYEFAKILHQQNLDWKRTLQTVVSHIGEAIGVEQGSLITIEDNLDLGQVYVIGAADTPQNRDREMWNTLVRHGLIGYVYHGGRIVNVRNIQNDPLWPNLPDSAVLPNQGSAIGIPLTQHKNTLGVLMYVHPQIDYFVEERRDLLIEMTKIASAAIANAKEMQLVRSRDVHYQSIFEHTAVPIVLTNSDGLIQDVNYKASEYLGFRRSTLIGLPIHDINVLSVDDLSLDGLNVNEETYVRTSVYDIDGMKLPTLVRLRHVKVDGKLVLEWVLQDISTQIELEQLRRDMTSMVFHDLRGPLTNMQVVIHKLAEVLSKHQNPAVLKLLTLGLRSTQQLQRLVDSLLDIQRLEEGNSILNRHPTEMQPVLKNAVQLVQPLASEADQTLTFHLTPIPMLMLDNDMITRVAVNLLENAIKYTPNGGSVRLEAEMKDETIIVSIIDSGPGIPEEMRVRIFDKFSRVNYENAPKGVGLGLNFCKLAVEAHGGRIWVESDGKNGSSFRFSLPAILYEGDGPTKTTSQGQKKKKSTEEVAASA